MPRARREEKAPMPAPVDAEAVYSGRAFWGGRLQAVDVAVDADGWIVGVARSIRGGRRKDFGERVLIPTATDLHVHFRDPGGPDAADSFESGTLQAALGGVGLVGDMPNTTPPVTDTGALEAKADRTRGRLAVDAFLYALAADPSRIERLGRRAGAFKIYLSPTTGVATPPTLAEVGALLRRIAGTGLAVSVHAELPSEFERGPMAEPEDTAAWNRIRPLRAEIGAVEAVLRAAPSSVRLNFAHMTSIASTERVAAAGFCAEVTPQHLLLAARARGPAREKVNPPLRTEADRAALWRSFAAGRIPLVASDHAPHPVERKEERFERAPSGMPGVETMLPLLLAEVRSDRLALPTLLAASCDRPARWIGAPVGRIAPGHRADFLVVDFTRRRSVRARSLHAPCGWSAFEGREAIFPLEHYRAGSPIVSGGEFVGDRAGELVRPEYARHGPTGSRD